MKYGESAFDILYLLFAILCGAWILGRARDKTEKHMGLAALILGLGDAFHLVPRVLNYFVPADFTAALGLGKLVTSITMTVFYVLMYTVFLGHYGEAENRTRTRWVWALALLRVALCLFPQNGWLQNGGDTVWAVLRNLPFVLLGALIGRLYWKNRGKDPLFRFVWLYILLSFLFYIPVAVGAGFLPMLGMLMLPKTICYVLLLCVFLRSVIPDSHKKKTPSAFHRRTG